MCVFFCQACTTKGKIRVGISGIVVFFVILCPDMRSRRIKQRWTIPPGEPLSSIDRRALEMQSQGFLLPTRDMIKTPEQIEGIMQECPLKTSTHWYTNTP